MNYLATDLDNALVQIRDANISLRKIGVKFFLKASCLELGTKNTVPIREWIIEPDHRDALLKNMKAETDVRLLCEYVTLLHMFCKRYIDGAKNIKNSEDFIKNPLCLKFKQKVFHIAEAYLHADSPELQLEAAYFLIDYGNRNVWDTVTLVVSKKTSFTILTKVSDCVSILYYYLIGNGKNMDIVDVEGAIINWDFMVSPSQLIELKTALCKVCENNVKRASKSGLSRVLGQIDEIFQYIEKQESSSIQY